METRIKTQFGPIRYERTTNFPLQEGAFLSQSIKEAFIYLSASLSKLKNGKIDESLVNYLFNDDKEPLQILENLIEKFKNKELIFEKERAYSDSEGNADTSVLASVSEGGEIKIYNAFFNTKEIKDNRAGVIIHETSHLAGLEGESNTNETTANPNSAEAVKNFCLCACGKLSLEEINREKESPENSEDEEPTYRPDQPRAPKGQSDGGQWVSEGGGNGKSSKGKDKEGTSNSDAGETPNENTSNPGNNTNSKIDASDELKWKNIDDNPSLSNDEKREFMQAANDILEGKREDYANIQKGEVQYEEEKVWMSFNTLFKTPFQGRQTIILNLTYQEKDSDTGEETSFSKESIAFDAIEENGLIGIWRLTPIGGSTPYYYGTTLTTSIDVYAVEGPAKDSFQSFNSATTDNGWAYDAVVHASDIKYVVTGSNDNYNDSNGGPYKGGSVKNIPINKGKNPKKIFSRKIEFDGINTKADRMERTAADKYGHRMQVDK